MSACRSLLALTLVALAIAVPSASGGSRADVIFFRDVGPAGANGAFLVSSDSPSAVVVFLHGWRDVGTGPYYDWIQEIAFGGPAVVFPRYQPAAGGSPAATLPALRSGIEAALAALRNPDVPLIVVGYDYGARLAFYYAANAKSWGLPVPFAVDSVFPSTARAGLPGLGGIPASTRVVLQVSANDTRAAADLWSDLKGHSAARKQLRLVKAAGHRSPLADTAATRAAFWSPLDTLIAQAARRASGARSDGRARPPRRSRRPSRRPTTTRSPRPSRGRAPRSSSSPRASATARPRSRTATCAASSSTPSPRASSAAAGCACR